MMTTKCNHGLWRIPDGWRDTGAMRDGRCLLHYADTGVYCLWDGAALSSCPQDWAAYADLTTQLGTQREVARLLGCTERTVSRKQNGGVVHARDVMAVRQALRDRDTSGNTTDSDLDRT